MVGDQNQYASKNKFTTINDANVHWFRNSTEIHYTFFCYSFERKKNMPNNMKLKLTIRSFMFFFLCSCSRKLKQLFILQVQVFNFCTPLKYSLAF